MGKRSVMVKRLYRNRGVGDGRGLKTWVRDEAYNHPTCSSKARAAMVGWAKAKGLGYLEPPF